MNEFERRVAATLEENGWCVVAKGKGYDLLALKPNIALLIECKGWNRSIKGKTLRKIVGRLKKEYRELDTELVKGREVIPVLVVADRIEDMYKTEPVKVFNFKEFKRFLEIKGKS
ncbi:MAG: restriction endonuclease [Methermicoccaceae archaeon]